MCLRLTVQTFVCRDSFTRLTGDTVADAFSYTINVFCCAADGWLTLVGCDCTIWLSCFGGMKTCSQFTLKRIQDVCLLHSLCVSCHVISICMRSLAKRSLSCGVFAVHVAEISCHFRVLQSPFHWIFCWLHFLGEPATIYIIFLYVQLIFLLMSTTQVLLVRYVIYCVMHVHVWSPQGLIHCSEN